jgi:Ca2+-binding RTX toxin-like protein
MGMGRIVAFGDDNNDRLEAGSADDHLYGGNGDDLIDGGAGQDWIEGGADSDTLIGGDGSDTIWGGTESDLIAGDLAVVEGDFTTSIFRSIASAAGGNDAINGGDGIDILFGSSGSDTISGNAGQDFIFGDDGKATIQPGAVPVVTQLSLGLSGDDVAIWNVGDGNDIVDGSLEAIPSRSSAPATRIN